MSLINRRRVRTFIIEFSAREGGRAHSRVAEDIYEALEAKVRELCRYYVKVSPGKTVSLVTKQKVKEEINDL
jgi:hypothetical protein